MLQALLDDPAVESVRTVARRPLPLEMASTVPRNHSARPADRLAHVRADLRSPEARRAVGGVDVLFHLGFQLWPGRKGPDAMEAVNVAGTANVLAGAPGRVVLASSAAVYGAWPENPLPLVEGEPARPNREVRYAAQKLVVERLCAQVAPTVALRIAAVLGDHVDPGVARAVHGYRWAVPAVRGVRQAVQFIDEGDVVAALLASARPHTPPGVINISTEDWLDAHQIAELSGGRVLALPRTAVMAASELGRSLRLLPFGADRAALIGGPLALSPVRARAVLDWSPRWSSQQVLRRALRTANVRRTAKVRSDQTAR